MSAESKTKDEKRPNDGEKRISIGINSDLDLTTNPHRHGERTEASSCWTWLSVFVALTVLFLVVAIGGVCRSQPVDSLSWPYVAMIAAFLSAIVALCWIGCRHSARMEKMSSEERKQKVDVQRFLFEKSIELAQAMSNGDGGSSQKTHSVLVTSYRPCGGDKHNPEGAGNENNDAPAHSSAPPDYPPPGSGQVATEDHDESESKDHNLGPGKNGAPSFYERCQMIAGPPMLDCVPTSAGKIQG